MSRTAATSVATVAVSIGYALILLAAMLASGDAIGPRRAALWGACAFAATGLATALGLAPQLPGMAETELAARQIWWLATALSTGAGLYALLRLDSAAADTSAALMVGDRIHDVEGAARLGLDTVLVAWGYGGPEERSRALTVAADPDDLLRLVGA